MRHARTLAALAAGGLLAAGAAAPAAMAADDCPNAAVRAQQQSQRLPSCMAYERVSPADKNGATPGATAATADGDRVLTTMNSGLADNVGFLNGNYRMSRSASGWATTALSPPFNGVTPALGDLSDPVLWSDDLERVVIPTLYAISPNDQGRIVGRTGSLGSADVYLRESDGSFTWIAPDPSVVDSSTLPVRAVGGSKDLDRVVVTTARSFDPRVTTTDVNHVYVWTRSGTRLASILPNGDLATSLTVPSMATVAITTQAVSDDGRRVAFTDGQWGEERLYVRYNADDPATAVTREVAVGPDGERCDPGGTDTQMLKLSADGTQMLFQCNSQILPGGPQQGVYLRDLDGGPEAVRLVGPSYLGPRFMGGNDDLSRFYMQGVGDDDSLVLVRDGVPKKIAKGTRRLEGEGEQLMGMAASPNGEYFTFQGRHDYGVPGVDIGRVGTDAVFDPSVDQVYRYSARTDELSCVSCRQDGSPTDGEALLNPSVGYTDVGDVITQVADNGAVTFSTATGLDPADTNGVQDAYVWLDGRQVLLSSGRGAEKSASNGTTRGGTAFIFATGDSLVPDDRDGGAYDVYVARADGGFLVPEAPTVCTSSCQTPGPDRPSLPGLGSADLVGPGNLVERDPSTSRATAALTVSRSVRGTSTSVRVKVSHAGSIRVSGAGLRQATVKAKKAGTYRVTVRLSANGAKQQKKRGRLSTKLTARFTPASGASVTARKSVTFTAKKGGR